MAWAAARRSTWCTSSKKVRQDVTDCVAEIDAERADTEPKGVHAHPCALQSYRQETRSQTCRECHQTVGGKVLLGLDHAGQDRDDNPRFRDY